MIIEVNDYKGILCNHLEIDDWQAVEIILAVIAAHKYRGEMVWLRVIGAAGSGKTEILRSVAAVRELKGFKDYVDTIESLTPASIRRGHKNENQPLLARIDGKLVITKELAPLLTRDKESKLEIFGLLRSVKDGELDADYGSDEGHIRQKSHFDWILASTCYVDRQAQLDALLGPRFIDLRWGRPLDRLKAIGMAMEKVEGKPSIRKKLSEAIGRILDALPNTINDPPVTEWELRLVDLVSNLRTPVQRDGRDKELVALPEPELGTRIGESFQRIKKGLVAIGVEDCTPYLIRLAWDSIPKMRADILREAMNGNKSEREIASSVGYSQPTIHYVHEDLKLLKFDRLKDFETLKGGLS